MNKGGETVLGHVLMFGASGLLPQQRSGPLAAKLTGMGALVSLPAFQVRGRDPGGTWSKELLCMDGGLEVEVVVWCALGTSMLGRWQRGSCRAGAGRLVMGA